MATQARAMSMSRAQASRSPQGLFGQVSAVLVQPKAFFRLMPRGRHWLWVAALVLLICGFAASRQAQLAATTTSTGSASSSDGFSLALLQDSTDTETSSSQTTTTQTTTSADTDTALMSALEAAFTMAVMWFGQAVLLCLIPMFSGRPPKVGPSLQIAVWASVPLALMLALRQVFFAAGGSGGAVGLSLLLDQWDGYAQLSSDAQDLLAAFMSQITLFWLWNLLLLFLGARYTLRGKYWAISLILVIWIAVVPVATVLVGEPVTTVSPRAESSSSASDSNQNTASSSTTSTTTQQFNMGSMSSSGFPSGGGEAPSGGGPGSSSSRP